MTNYLVPYSLSFGGDGFTHSRDKFKQTPEYRLSSSYLSTFFSRVYVYMLFESLKKNE